MYTNNMHVQLHIIYARVLDIRKGRKRKQPADNEVQLGPKRSRTERKKESLRRKERKGAVLLIMTLFN